MYHTKLIFTLLLFIVICSAGIFIVRLADNSPHPVNLLSPTPRPEKSVQEKDTTSTETVTVQPQVRALDTRNFIITILLTSSDSARIDAADLKVAVPEQIFELTGLQTGQSLEMCPNKTVNMDYLILTCTTNKAFITIDGNKPVTLVRFHLYLKPPFRSGRINFPSQGTKFFYRGKRILLKVPQNPVLIPK